MSLFKPTFNGIMDATLNHINNINSCNDYDMYLKIKEYGSHILKQAKKVDSMTYYIAYDLIYKCSLHEELQHYTAIHTN